MVKLFFIFFGRHKYLFFKFINKCQKEILRCAPPSHVCDFLNLSGAEILKLNKDKVQQCVLDIKNNITWFNYQAFYFELL